MGKPTICIGKNKDADQLRGYREADQRLCFRYSDSTIPLLLKSEISSFQAGLCWTCSEATLVFPQGGSFFIVLKTFTVLVKLLLAYKGTLRENQRSAAVYQ